MPLAHHALRQQQLPAAACQLGQRAQQGAAQGDQLPVIDGPPLPAQGLQGCLLWILCLGPCGCGGSSAGSRVYLLASRAFSSSGNSRGAAGICLVAGLLEGCHPFGRAGGPQQRQEGAAAQVAQRLCCSGVGGIRPQQLGCCHHRLWLDELQLAGIYKQRRQLR